MTQSYCYYRPLWSSNHTVPHTPTTHAHTQGATVRSLERNCHDNWGVHHTAQKLFNIFTGYSANSFIAKQQQRNPHTTTQIHTNTHTNRPFKCNGAVSNLTDTILITKSLGEDLSWQKNIWPLSWQGKRLSKKKAVRRISLESEMRRCYYPPIINPMAMNNQLIQWVFGSQKCTEYKEFTAGQWKP